jgi:hypothetical protein
MIVKMVFQKNSISIGGLKWPKQFDHKLVVLAPVRQSGAIWLDRHTVYSLYKQDI